MDIVRLICAILLAAARGIPAGRHWRALLAQHPVDVVWLHSGDHPRGLDHRQEITPLV